jgi:hypothetical protein
VKTAITAIIALSAAALTATAPAVFAQGALSKSPSVQHVSKKRHPGVSGYSLRHETRCRVPPWNQTQMLVVAAVVVLACEPRESRP